MVRKASCCCGHSYVRVSGEPTLYGICHCDDCKRRTGSAFGMNAYFHDTQVVETVGDMATYAVRDEQQRSFCTQCGTTLFWKSKWQPDATGLSAGCFVDEPLGEPGLTVANEGRCSWVSLPNGWATSIGK